MTDEDFEALCAWRDANAARIAQLAILGADLENDCAEKRALVAENSSIELQLRRELTTRTDPEADFGDYAIECFSSNGESVLRIPMTAARQEVLSFASSVPLPPQVTMLRVVSGGEKSAEHEILRMARGVQKD